MIFKRIDDQVAQQLQTIALHEIDLNFCLFCLSQLKSLNTNKQSDLAEALWVSCIARFFKCFGKSKARFPLSARTIFKSDPKLHDAYRYFRALRNKHIIHDENALSRAFVAVVINPPEHENPVAEVDAWPLHVFLVDVDREPLRNLIDATHTWVTGRRTELEKALAVTYGQWTRDKLLALPDLAIPFPRQDDVFTAR